MNYHIEYAKDDDGNEIKWRFILTTKKPIAPMKSEMTQDVSMAQKMLGAIMAVPGINLFEVAGRYSVEIVVAKTYDPEKVLAEILEAIRPLQSDIICPSDKLIT